MDRPVIVCGLGRVGWRVLDAVRAAGLAVTVIDLYADPADPRLAGLTFLKRDCRRPEVLEQAGLAAAGGVVIVTSDDLVNVSTALLVRRLNPAVRVVVRMFNQSLIPRLGAAVKNTVALSVSALTAPLLALTAVSGDALGAFRLDAGPQQIAEVTVPDGAAPRAADFAARGRVVVLAHAPRRGAPALLADVSSDTRLSPGDEVVVCGAPADVAKLAGGGEPDDVAVLWAGWVRRQLRTLGRTVAAIDTPVRLATLTLFLTLFVSTLVFRFGVGTGWADGLYQSVSVVATGSDLKGEGKDGWVKVFLSGLKIAGAALIAGFTAIFTNYLLRARLGGVLEARRIPDGGHVVVCGLGNVGFRCVEELVRLGQNVVAVEKVNDNPFAATVRRMGVPAVVGDGTVPEVLRQANAATARAVIAVTSSELANLEIALLVRELNPAQRVVVRLTDPEFAQAVREAADIRNAVSVPALAAPAFAAALFGDRVQTLVTVAGRTLAVVDVAVQPNDPCLHEQTLAAAAADYRFRPVALSGVGPFAVNPPPRTHRLAAGETLTIVAELADLERLLRRQPAPADRRVVVASLPLSAKPFLAPLLTANRGLTPDDAERTVGDPPFVVAEKLTRGEAEELVSHLGREKVEAYVEAS